MIITTKQGRKKSIITPKEIDNRAGEVVSSLTEEERELFFRLIGDSPEEQIKMDEELLDHRYHTVPVSMEQFLEDPYYLGESCTTMYPEIRKDLIALFDYPYRQAVLTGGIGIGKTFSLSIAICRIFYELSCLISPQKTFNLSSGSELVIPLISKNLPLAREVMKTAVDDKIKESTYFMEKFTPRFSKDNTVFPSNIRLTIASYGSERILGTTVIACGMDETNFPPKRKDQQITTGMGQKRTLAHFDPVEKLYRTLLRRIESRFLGTMGDFPGMVILASSANTLESFTERKIKDSIDKPEVFVRDHAPWTIKPADRFSDEKFWVLCSTSSMRSRILEEDEYDLITDEYLEENDAWIMDIPVDFREDFEIDLENAMRDIAGISTQAVSAYIQRVEAVDECASDKIPHAFSMDEWTSGGPGSWKWNTLCREYERRMPGGFTELAHMPKVNPKKMRWCHIDASISGDSTGFCVGHIDRWVEVVRRGSDGEKYTDTAPFYYIDAMLRINPPRGEQIYFPDVRRLVYELQAHGYVFSGVSTDTFMYVEMHQQLRRRGITPHLLSMDKTTEPYDELKAAIYEKRIVYHKYMPFIEELKALEYDRIKGKIDHSTAGTKDVADAVCGVVASLAQSAKSLPMGLGNDNHKKDVHDHSWVSPLIPASQVDVEDAREMAEDAGSEMDFLPIIFGD